MTVRDTKGRFASTGRIDKRSVKQELARTGVRFNEKLMAKNRMLALALRRLSSSFADELGGSVSASAQALIDVVSRTKLLVDTLDVLLPEIGPAIVNRRKKVAYPLLQQRQQLADSLAAQLRTFAELRVATELEQRIAQLEEARHVVGR